MGKLKINNRKENPLYLKIKCVCNKNNIETCYPLVDCIHCHCKRADDSIPTQSFKVKQPIYDKHGKDKGMEQIEIKEITLSNCNKYGSCLGWSF
tara:strand:- start:1603 stop:1884 length:282 start_codon:yes stop_codon:yes gene_type:complete